MFQDMQLEKSYPSNKVKTSGNQLLTCFKPWMKLKGIIRFITENYLLQNELLTCLWYLNLGYTLRGLEVFQKFNNDDNDDKYQYRCQ